MGRESPKKQQITRVLNAARSARWSYPNHPKSRNQSNNTRIYRHRWAGHKRHHIGPVTILILLQNISVQRSRHPSFFHLVQWSCKLISSCCCHPKILAYSIFQKTKRLFWPKKRLIPQRRSTVKEIFSSTCGKYIDSQPNNSLVHDFSCVQSRKKHWVPRGINKKNYELSGGCYSHPPSPGGRAPGEFSGSLRGADRSKHMFNVLTLNTKAMKSRMSRPTILLST